LATGGLATAYGAGTLTSGALGGLAFGVGERAQMEAQHGGGPIQQAKAAAATPSVVANDAMAGMAVAGAGKVLAPAVGKLASRIPAWLSKFMAAEGRAGAPSTVTPSTVTPSAVSEPTVTLRGTNRAASGGVVTDRGTFRQQTLTDEWDEAAPGPTRGRLCPTCAEEVHVAPGQGARDWDVSHDPSWTNREFPPDVTREEVLDSYQEGTFLECPQCNRPRGNQD